MFNKLVSGTSVKKFVIAALNNGYLAYIQFGFYCQSFYMVGSCNAVNGRVRAELNFWWKILYWVDDMFLAPAGPKHVVHPIKIFPPKN
jgi:hypothetical protein